MKPDQIYQALVELAEKLGIEVREQNFRATGVKAGSGLCRLRGKPLFLMDKHLNVHRKIRLLARELSRHPTEELFIVPVVREVLERHAPAGGGGAGQAVDPADDEDDDVEDAD